MTAEGDFLRKQAPYMYGKLKEKNVFCELHEYSSPKEKLMHVFHLNMRSEDAKRCNDDECEFFRKFIREVTGNEKNSYRSRHAK